MKAVRGRQKGLGGGVMELKQAYFNFIHHKILAKAAAIENKSTFTSSLSNEIAPEGKITPKGT